MMLSLYTEAGEPTLELAPFIAEDDEPTLDVQMTKSDAIYEAHERMRAGNAEAAGVWLLVAGGL